MSAGVHDFGSVVEVVGTEAMPDTVTVLTRHGEQAGFARRLAASAVVTFSHDTDFATGSCSCSLCKRPIDFWDSFCRHCGAELSRND